MAVFPVQRPCGRAYAFASLFVCAALRPTELGLLARLVRLDGAQFGFEVGYVPFALRRRYHGSRPRRRSRSAGSRPATGEKEWNRLDDVESSRRIRGVQGSIGTVSA